MAQFILKTRVVLLVLVGGLLFAPQLNAQSGRADKQAAKMEKKADALFTKQQFENAMNMYETIFGKQQSMSSATTARLHLKTARLYNSLLNHESTIVHFESLMKIDESLMEMGDICSYLDALRYTGDVEKALLFCRKHAYEDIYSRNQRYKNILHALSRQNRNLMTDGNEFEIKRMKGINSPYSEYWVGQFKDNLFFASSQSVFHDASKRFFHRTKFNDLILGEDTRSEKDKRLQRDYVSYIPIDLQTGPVSFSDDYERMIITEIEYDKRDRIEVTADGAVFYKTKLKFSTYNHDRNGWSKFVPAFPQDPSASYAHACIIEGGNAIVFSSNVSGGYGGFDLYIAFWDNSLNSWGNPLNLGPEVNTEGDEIGAKLFGDYLYFSSNGQVGFGGYDIYSVLFENRRPLSGSLSHLGGAINTVYNDYSIFFLNQDEGFVISDRNLKSKDDIYTFKRNFLGVGASGAFGGLNESRAVSTGTMDVLGMNGGADAAHRNVSIPGNGMRDANGELSESLYTVYFEFDKYYLDVEAKTHLDKFIAEMKAEGIQRLDVIGYADEMGSEYYNNRLSGLRAATVATYLSKNGITLRMKAYGLGRVSLTENELKSEAMNINGNLISAFDMGTDFRKAIDPEKWIKLNRKARRVEIKAIY